MIDLDIWECRVRHISVRHSVWRKKQSSAMRGSYVWWVMLNCLLRQAICPLSHYAWWKVSLKGRRVFFLLCGRRCSGLSKCSESTIYKQRRHGDKRVLWEIIVFISCTAWYHVYYDYLTVTSSVQLPGQLLKVCADRRKNGRLRKYHYSKIQNAGDCVARTGVREIGFKFGSLPHDPGGITCMTVLNSKYSGN